MSSPPCVPSALISTPLHHVFYYFYHFKGSGAYQIRSSSDFPRGTFSSHAEENITKTEPCCLIATDNISCLPRLSPPTPCRCLLESPPWWWRVGRWCTTMPLRMRRTRRKTRCVSAPWTCWAATVSVNTHPLRFYEKVNPFKESKNTTIKQHITAFMRANFNIYLHFIVF